MGGWLVGRARGCGGGTVAPACGRVVGGVGGEASGARAHGVPVGRKEGGRAGKELK